MFGAELSQELISALYYVDVHARIVRLTGGGWVRDAGDRLYASDADPVVVALIVKPPKPKVGARVAVSGSPSLSQRR